MNSSSHEQFKKLHKLLIEHFSQGELKTLCFYLNVDYETLDGDGKADKARELILYLERHKRIVALEDEIAKQRPDILLDMYPQVPTEHPPIQLPLGNNNTQTVQNVYGDNNAVAGTGGSATVIIQSHAKLEREKNNE